MARGLERKIEPCSKILSTTNTIFGNLFSELDIRNTCVEEEVSFFKSENRFCLQPIASIEMGQANWQSGNEG